MRVKKLAGCVLWGFKKIIIVRIFKIGALVLILAQQARYHLKADNDVDCSNEAAEYITIMVSECSHQSLSSFDTLS